MGATLLHNYLRQGKPSGGLRNRRIWWRTPDSLLWARHGVLEGEEYRSEPRLGRKGAAPIKGQIKGQPDSSSASRRPRDCESHLRAR